MVSSCSASGCKTRYIKGVKFHKFPKDNNLRNRWIEAIGRLNFQPSETAVICNKHFKEGDYYINAYRNRVLKKDAIPSVFNVLEGKKNFNLENNIEKEVMSEKDDEIMSEKEEVLSENEVLLENEGEIVTEKEKNLLSENLSPKKEILSSETLSVNEGMLINEKERIILINKEENLSSETLSAKEEPLSSKETISIDGDEIMSIKDDEETISVKDEETISALEDEEETLSAKEDENNEITPFNDNFNKLTSLHRKRKAYRYVGDVKNADFTSPEEAKKSLEIALGCVENQKRKIKRLRQQVRNLNKSVHKLEVEMQRILSKKLIKNNF